LLLIIIFIPPAVIAPALPPIVIIFTLPPAIIASVLPLVIIVFALPPAIINLSFARLFAIPLFLPFFLNFT